MSILNETDYSEEQYQRDLELMKDGGFKWGNAHWAGFYRLYRDRLVKRLLVTYKIGIPGYEAKDIVNEALASMARSTSFKETFDPSNPSLQAEEPAYSYAWTVIRRRASRLLDRYREYELQLVLDEPLPEEGKRKLVVARCSNDSLHFRIFDKDKKRKDYSEQSLSSKSLEIEKLKDYLLQYIWGKDSIDREQHAFIIRQVESIVGRKLISKRQAETLMEPSDFENNKHSFEQYTSVSDHGGFYEQIDCIYKILHLQSERKKLKELDYRRNPLSVKEKRDRTNLRWKLTAPLYFFAYNWLRLPAPKHVHEHRIFERLLESPESILFSTSSSKDGRLRQMMRDFALTYAKDWVHEFEGQNCKPEDVVKCMIKIIKQGYLREKKNKLDVCRAQIGSSEGRSRLKIALNSFETGV